MGLWAPTAGRTWWDGWRRRARRGGAPEPHLTGSHRPLPLSLALPRARPQLFVVTELAPGGDLGTLLWCAARRPPAGWLAGWPGSPRHATAAPGCRGLGGGLTLLALSAAGAELMPPPLPARAPLPAASWTGGGRACLRQRWVTGRGWRLRHLQRAGTQLLRRPLAALANSHWARAYPPGAGVALLSSDGGGSALPAPRPRAAPGRQGGSGSGKRRRGEGTGACIGGRAGTPKELAACARTPDGLPRPPASPRPHPAHLPAHPPALARRAAPQPENVLLGEGGLLKLADFGIAQVLDRVFTRVLVSLLLWVYFLGAFVFIRSEGGRAGGAVPDRVFTRVLVSGPGGGLEGQPRRLE